MYGRGSGINIRTARQEAAKKAIEEHKKKGIHIHVA